MNEDQIYQKLLSTKLNSIQIDPYGYCNNTCWFCPRGHIPNPRIYKRHMPISLMDHIIRQFVEGKGTICEEQFSHIWTGHYNEILLYRHFGGFLNILEKYKLCTTILSSGLNYTTENIGQILDGINKNTIVGICMNIPAGEPVAYERYTRNGPDKFNKMVSGVSALLAKLPEWIVKAGAVSIVVNGIEDAHADRERIGPNAPEIPMYDLDHQVDLLQALFPRAKVYKAGYLVDRSGKLSTLGIFDHSSLFATIDEEVVGCHNCGDIGGRPFAWAHINSLGELFLCCNDYSFEYTFGSLVDTPLADLWYSKDHVKMIMKAFDGICRTCCSAVKVKRNG